MIEFMQLLNPKRRAGGISIAFLTGLLAVCSAAPAQDVAAVTPSPALSPTAPESYTVRQGDTLWDISKVFLRDPWVWPEIWYVNPQIENPHLIYPGDVLTLTRGADGRPRLTLERGGTTRLSPQIRSEPLMGPITTIPYAIIAAFMSRPTVLEKDQIKAAPHVVSSRDQHLIAAEGNTIYARGGSDDRMSNGQINARYAIVNVAEPLRDPDDRDVVGYLAHYTASARLTRGGDPATLEITKSDRETLNGDKLIPDEADIALDFIPHAPSQDMDGRIISLVNGLSIVGQYQVVIINRGKQHGIEPGHVLGIYQVGGKVHDSSSGASKTMRTFSRKVQLPDERAGTFMVFKTFDRISYGLIMEAQTPIRELDRVSNP